MSPCVPRNSRSLCGYIATGVLLICLLTTGRPVFSQQQQRSKPDLSSKIVLANPANYPAAFRVGKSQRQVAAKKASVLSPKKYPITLEFWSGKPELGWQKFSFTEAGVYTFNLNRGQWSVSMRAKRTGPRTAQRRQAPARRATVNRTTGSRSYAARGNYYGGRPVQRIMQAGRGRAYRGGGSRRYSRRVNTLHWVGNALGLTYRIIRDESDRRDLRRIMRDVRRGDYEEFRRWLEKPRQVPLPADAQRELEEAYKKLGDLSDEDWKSLEEVTDDDWNQVRDILGDKINDQDWEDISRDFEGINTNDFWEEPLPGTLDEGDISLGDLADSATGDVDVADLEGLDEAVGLDDLLEADVSIEDVGNLDLGDLDMGDFDLGDLGLGDYDLGGAFVEDAVGGAVGDAFGEAIGGAIVEDAVGGFVEEAAGDFIGDAIGDAIGDSIGDAFDFDFDF